MFQVLPRRFAAAALAAVLAAGCGAAPQPGTPGVTDTTILLGVLTDQSGPFASVSRSMAQGRQLYWDGRNNGSGGVCGRRVEFVVRDHGYDTGRAVAAYAELRGSVLAMDELLGSPMLTELLPEIKSDQMVTFAASFSHRLLANPYVIITGATYDVEMINGVQWLGENKGLQSGAKVAHIFIEGDYGESALAGSRAAAEEFKLELSEYRITAADTDLTGVMTAVRDAGIRYVLLSTTPAQTAAVVLAGEKLGHDAWFVGSNPTFSPGLLAGPARAALERRLTIATSTAPFAEGSVGPAAVREAFRATFPKQPRTSWVMFGYAQGLIMGEILDAACRGGKLTRPGLREALANLPLVDARQLIPPLSYQEPGEIPARESYLVRPDGRVEGGLATVGLPFAAPLARIYERQD